MTKESLFEYIEGEYGVNADYPFSEHWNPSPVFRHKDNKKWFALGMFISRNKLHGGAGDNTWVLNVKCDPLLKNALFDKKGFYPSYHMNREHWISIVLDEADSEDVKFAVSMSYDLTKAKYRKKKQSG